MRKLSFVPVLAMALTVMGSTGEAADPPSSVRVSYISFATLHPDKPLITAGRLMVPRGGKGKVPAVLVVHGANGPDSRGPLMAEILTKAGIATLEIDMWAPRGLVVGSTSRPPQVTEALPDAFGALKFLADHPAIDATRIGIMGFSFGGRVSMLTASKPLADRYGPPSLRFKAHASFYPLCWTYNNEQRPEEVFRELTGAPVFLQGGDLDTYDAPDSCRKLVDSLPEASRKLVRLTMHPGATHEFDSTGSERMVSSPLANLGRGGQARVTPNPEIAARAREATAKFFSEVFGLKQARMSEPNPSLQTDR